MKILNVTLERVKMYQGKLIVPDEMSMEEAMKYAKRHINDITLTDISGADYELRIDEDKSNFTYEEEYNWKNFIEEAAKTKGFQVDIADNIFTFTTEWSKTFYSFQVKANTLEELYHGIIKAVDEMDISKETYIRLDENGHGKNGKSIIDIYESLRKCKIDMESLTESIRHYLICFKKMEEIKNKGYYESRINPNYIRHIYADGTSDIDEDDYDPYSF